MLLLSIKALHLIAVIAWLAAQPWCSGEVHMVGRSYGAAAQWLTAALAPTSGQRKSLTSPLTSTRGPSIAREPVACSRAPELGWRSSICRAVSVRCA